MCVRARAPVRRGNSILLVILFSLPPLCGSFFAGAFFDFSVISFVGRKILLPRGGQSVVSRNYTPLTDIQIEKGLLSSFHVH